MALVASLLRPLHRQQPAQRDRQGELTTRAADIVAGLRVLRGIGGEQVFAERYRRGVAGGARGGVRVARVESVLEARPGAAARRLRRAGDLARRAVRDARPDQRRRARRVLRLRRVPDQPAAHADRGGRQDDPGARRRPPGGPAAALEPEITDPATRCRCRRPGASWPTCVRTRPAARPAHRAGRRPPRGRHRDRRPARPVRRRRRHAAAACRCGPLALGDGPRRGSWWPTTTPGCSPACCATELDPPAGPAPGAVEAALHAACAEDIVEALPGGLDACVAERGRAFSGGQQQRLRLARALLADPEILVLVEPTSAVDAHTEARIADRLRRGPRRPDHRGLHDQPAGARPRRPGGASSGRPGRRRGHPPRAAAPSRATARHAARTSRRRGRRSRHEHADARCRSPTRRRSAGTPAADPPSTRGALASRSACTRSPRCAGLVGPRLLGDLVRASSRAPPRHRRPSPGLAAFVVAQAVLIRYAYLRRPGSASGCWPSCARSSSTGCSPCRCPRSSGPAPATCSPAPPATSTRCPAACGTRAGDADRRADRAAHLGALVLVGPLLALPCLLVVPLLLVATRWYLRRAPDGYLRENAAYAEITDGLAETVEGARTVEALRLGGRRRARDRRRHPRGRTPPSATPCACARCSSRPWRSATCSRGGDAAPRRLALPAGLGDARPGHRRHAVRPAAHRPAGPAALLARRAAGRRRRRWPGCSGWPRCRDDRRSPAGGAAPGRRSELAAATSGTPTARAVTCCTASTSTSGRASGWRWSARPVPASRRWAGCSPASRAPRGPVTVGGACPGRAAAGRAARPRRAGHPGAPRLRRHAARQPGAGPAGRRPTTRCAPRWPRSTPWTGSLALPDGLDTEVGAGGRALTAGAGPAARAGPAGAGRPAHAGPGRGDVAARPAGRPAPGALAGRRAATAAR